MATFTIMCSCGDVQSVRAETHDEAVALLTRRWSAGVLNAHMREKHPNERVPNSSELQSLIAHKLVPIEIV